MQQKTIPVMSVRSLHEDDPLEDFVRREITLDGVAKRVYVAGAGPAVRERLEREDLTVMAYRFEGDKHCRAERFAAYREALGERFVARVLPDSAANPDVPPFFREVVGSAHSVVTAHLIDEA